MKKLFILILIISACKNSNNKKEEIICGEDKEMQLGRVTIKLPDCYSFYIDTIRYSHPHEFIIKGNDIKLQVSTGGKGNLESGEGFYNNNKFYTVEIDTMNDHYLRRIISSKVKDKFYLLFEIVDLIPDTVKYPAMLKELHKRKTVHRAKQEEKPDSVSLTELIKQHDKEHDEMIDSMVATNIHDNYYYVITAFTKENVYLTNNEKDIFIKAFKKAKLESKNHEFDMESLDSINSIISKHRTE